MINTVQKSLSCQYPPNSDMYYYCCRRLPSARGPFSASMEVREPGPFVLRWSLCGLNVPGLNG